MTQTRISPASTQVGQLVTFKYENKDKVKSDRVGIVDSTYIDRFLLADFTEDRNPRMFLFPRITDCELLEWSAPTNNSPKVKNLGYYLRRIFGFS